MVALGIIELECPHFSSQCDEFQGKYLLVKSLLQIMISPSVVNLRATVGVDFIQHLVRTSACFFISNVE